jgi:hypothetical protein
MRARKQTVCSFDRSARLTTTPCGKSSHGAASTYGVKGIAVQTLTGRGCSRRVITAIATGLAIATLSSACQSSGEQGPSTPSTPTTTGMPTSTTPPSVAPTTKELSPTDGNLFTPGVKAPPAPTEPPGVHRHGS